MDRDKFMQEARLTAHRILEGKENGIMNLVQQAWAEGKRNAEVETLKEAIEAALNNRQAVTTDNSFYCTVNYMGETIKCYIAAVEEPNIYLMKSKRKFTLIEV